MRVVKPGPDRDVPRGVVGGEAAISRQLGARLIEELYRQSEPYARPRAAGGELTGREWEVLDLLRQGGTTKELAQRLFVSQVTVRRHISSILHKLRVPNRQAAVALLTHCE